MTAMRNAESLDLSLDEETEGSQYATLDEWGRWKMHEPANPWQDGSLHQQSTPTQANNIPRWQALTKDYRHITIPIAESTDLCKDLWLTSFNCRGLSEANKQPYSNQQRQTHCIMLAISTMWIGCHVPHGHTAYAGTRYQSNRAYPHTTPTWHIY